MRFVLLTPPAAEPLTLDELKAHCVVEHALDDALLTACGVAAREWCEDHCRRAFCTQTFDGYLDTFPCDREMRLGKGTLQTVDQVTYYDVDGAEQTLGPAVYHVDTVRKPGRLWLRSGQTWPATESGRPNAVKVQFAAGFGDPPDVPESIKSAIKLLVAHLYAQREPEITGTIISKVGFAVEALLAKHRLPRVDE
jgi:uncharacterized phiE125 gp8 family phage protein